MCTHWVEGHGCRAQARGVHQLWTCVRLPRFSAAMMVGMVVALVEVLVGGLCTAAEQSQVQHWLWRVIVWYCWDGALMRAAEVVVVAAGQGGVWCGQWLTLGRSGSGSCCCCWGCSSGLYATVVKRRLQRIGSCI